MYDQQAPPDSGDDGTQPPKSPGSSKTKTQRAKQLGKEEVKDVYVMLKGIKWLPYGEKAVEKELDEDGMLFKNTVELQENPLTALFLCVSSNIWQRFPKSMQIVFMLAVLLGVGLQWTSTIAIWLYLSEERRNYDSAEGQDIWAQVIGTFLSSAMLFLYLLGAVRVAFNTWQAALPRLGRDNLGWFVAANLFGDILLHFFVAFVCVMAISTQDNISDKLQASLAFFFICEVDEWIYIFFIQPFDVLDSDDFVLEDDKDEEVVEREEQGESRIDIMWDLRARRSIRWGAVLVALCGWSLFYAGFNVEKLVF